jgi:mannose-6-phosphate isomerase-like protein (cupin superfamily)
MTSQIPHKPSTIVTGTNYAAVHCGPYSGLKNYELDFPGRGIVKAGKVFLKELVNSTGLEVSLNAMAPGKKVPFSHAHKANEEMYIFIRGQGLMAIDGEYIPVQEGSCVRLAPSAVRCLKNTGTEDLNFIVVQAKANSLGEHTFDDGFRVEQELNW